MRWSTRAGGAAAVAAILVGAFMAPAAAAPGDGANGDADTTSAGGAPAVVLTQDATPILNSIHGSWGSFMQPGVGGFVVADETTSLHVTLPSELSASFNENWDYAVRTRDATQTLASGLAGGTAGSFTVPVPQSFRGFTELELLVTNGYASDSSLTPITLNAILHVHVELATTSSAVPLTKSSATAYGRGVMYTASPRDTTVAAGGSVTVVSSPGTWTHGPDGEWETPSPISVAIFPPGGGGYFGSTLGTASTDGSTVTFRLPRNAPYFPNGETSRAATVQITMWGADHDPGKGSIDVQAYLQVVPAIGPVVDRIWGSDRYDISTRVSYESYPDGSDVAFVVTGENYPDALSAAPAAVHRGGPLLLTPSTSLAPGVASELTRLQAKDVYVVGGVNSVSDAVVAQIEVLGATVHRIAGADRYEASRALAADTFGDTGSTLAYIATGGNFPDALAAGGAAGHVGAPVILVNGAASTLDEETRRQLSDLGVTQIKIAGGPASVSPGIEHDLSLIAPTTRLWGPDRLTAAAAINLDAYGTSDRAFLVTGYKFPDALTGSAWAGKLGAPLYVSTPDCVPAAVSNAVTQQGVKKLTLIGGPLSLSANVLEYVPCTP
jgi:putative cell wall-binding protein